MTRIFLYKLFDSLVKKYIKYHMTLSFLLVGRKIIYIRNYIYKYFYSI